MKAKLKKETKIEKMKIEVLDFVRLTLICFVFVFIVVKFVFCPVTVEGSSMYPTLVDQDFGFSNVFSTYVSDIERFEVVVISHEDIDDLWVKRVIGLPGEKIEYKDDKLYINDEMVEEPFFNQEYVAQVTNNHEIKFTADFGPYYLNEDEYFLMGDNRLVSKDSRAEGVGVFHKSSIVSKYVMVLYPFSEFGYVSNSSN